MNHEAHEEQEDEDFRDYVADPALPETEILIC